MSVIANATQHRAPRYRVDAAFTRLRLVALLIVCGLLVSCSATRLLYNQLDWLVVWYLDDYFSLTDEQRDALRESVDRHLEWHRTTQLPKYAEFCRDLEREWAQQPSVDILRRRHDELIGYWDAMLEYGLPDMARFLLSLTDEQVDEFDARVQESNAELLEEYSGETRERRLKQRRKSVVKITERFVGRLNQNQKGVVGQYVNNLHDNSQEWIEGRRLWQLEFMALLRERPADFEPRLRGLMLDPNQFDSAEYRRKVDENRELIFDMYEVMLYSLTEAQRATLSKRLKRYAKDFELLAAQVR